MICLGHFTIVCESSLKHCTAHGGYSFCRVPRLAWFTHIIKPSRESALAERVQGVGVHLALLWIILNLRSGTRTHAVVCNERLNHFLTYYCTCSYKTIILLPTCSYKKHNTANVKVRVELSWCKLVGRENHSRSETLPATPPQ